MKFRIITSFVWSLALGAQVIAGALNPSTVSADAKWVLHLDMEAFRKTQVGSFVTEQVLEKRLGEAEQERKLNLNINFRNIQGITAYGPAFEKNGDGVLLVKTTANVKKDLESLTAMAALAEGEKAVIRVPGSSFPVYHLNGDFFAAPDLGGHLVLAKSKEQIERARQVLLGKGQTISVRKSFSNYPETANTFFFLGMAEGFNELAPVPPQAQVLRETQGGRLVLGETGEKLFLNLILRGKSPEATTKISQVLQGIVALVSLGNSDKDLSELLGTARISSEAQNVVVNLHVPVAKAINKIKASEQGNGDAAGIPKS